MEAEKDFFDVLPIHPRPEKLEALSSYVVRLAEANSIISITGLTQTCFSDYLRATRHLYDFPLHSPECLQIAANCTEADIQAMTFHHLGEKFGRTYYPNTCYTFLEKSIAHHTRYCPYCLKYYGYRSLLWRFQSLKGCSEHSCYLLGACCHCNKTIPVFPFQSLVGVTTCNYCLKDLRKGQSQPLSPKEQEETLSFSQDLAFLLSPQSQETMITSPEYSIGKQFSDVRQTKGLSLQEAMNIVVHDKLIKLEGEGGMIGVDAQGNAAMIFNSAGMYRAMKSSHKSSTKINRYIGKLPQTSY